MYADHELAQTPLGVLAPRTEAQCPECRRIFNLAVEIEAAEWCSGHDCEA